MNTAEKVHELTEWHHAHRRRATPSRWDVVAEAWPRDTGPGRAVGLGKKQGSGTQKQDEPRASAAAEHDGDGELAGPRGETVKPEEEEGPRKKGTWRDALNMPWAP